ncbi:YciI family protein [Micromonospora sp. LOL_024]|uniref:YciI family protein n=1 Tax=Micromonospora sp. LOL_024 TaxID=3345412 RepID=UPI003A875356
MRYILLSWLDRDSIAVPGTVGWSTADLRTHFRYLDDLNQSLTTTGELVSSHTLAHHRRALIVRADARPATRIVRFSGSRALAGYWLIDCARPRRAIEIAALLSAAPGTSARPLNHPVEMRPVAGAEAPRLPGRPTPA